MKLEDSPQLRKGLQEVQAARGMLPPITIYYDFTYFIFNTCEEHERERKADAGIGSLFSGPNVYPKLAANPKTSMYLSDPSFTRTVCNFPLTNPFRTNARTVQLEQIRQNPALASQ